MIDRVAMDPSENGCKLFWQFVGSVVAHAGLGTITAGLIMTAVACLAGVFYLPVLVLARLPFPAPDGPLEALFFLGVVMWAFIIVAVVWGSIVAVKNKISASEREPSLVTQYIRAKKQKICPIVEYVD
jgi:hypothetical protein